MSDNPSIAAVARLLDCNEPQGSLATILFDHYAALSSEGDKSAYVIAIIGELLVAKARMVSVDQSPFL
jgi:hypothetical protein